MENKLLEIAYNQNIKYINKYLQENKIELSEKEKENRILFLNFVLTKYQKKIKKRSKIRKRLSKLY